MDINYDTREGYLAHLREAIANAKTDEDRNIFEIAELEAILARHTQVN